MRRRTRRRLPWLLCIVLGFLLGSGIEYWRLRPPGPFVPTLVAGMPPESNTIREDDQHLIRTWTLPETVNETARELEHELTQSDGWQPPTLRKLNPRTIQFARIHSPNGDFQFTRITVSDLGNGKTSLMIDEEPKQAHAFR